jgi:hypothetical protein
MGENQRASIGMSDDEITVFVEQQRSATIATVGPKGHDVERTRSWDHRKLGMPEMDVGGSTAPFLTR